MQSLKLTATAIASRVVTEMALSIGMAPFCGGDCSADCRSDHCMRWPANCWTGNKICCCASKFEAILQYLIGQIISPYDIIMDMQTTARIIL